jgi:hypothetical protein
MNLGNMTSTMERPCISSKIRRKQSIVRKGTRQVWEVFGVEVSEVIVCCGLCRACLKSHVEKKKPHL